MLTEAHTPSTPLTPQFRLLSAAASAQLEATADMLEAIGAAQCSLGAKAGLLTVVRKTKETVFGIWDTIAKAKLSEIEKDEMHFVTLVDPETLQDLMRERRRNLPDGGPVLSTKAACATERLSGQIRDHPLVLDTEEECNLALTIHIRQSQVIKLIMGEIDRTPLTTSMNFDLKIKMHGLADPFLGWIKKTSGIASPHLVEQATVLNKEIEMLLIGLSSAALDYLSKWN